MYINVKPISKLNRIISVQTYTTYLRYIPFRSPGHRLLFNFASQTYNATVQADLQAKLTIYDISYQ